MVSLVDGVVEGAVQVGDRPGRRDTVTGEPDSDAGEGDVAGAVDDVHGVAVALRLADAEFRRGARASGPCTGKGRAPGRARCPSPPPSRPPSAARGRAPMPAPSRPSATATRAQAGRTPRQAGRAPPSGPGSSRPPRPAVRPGPGRRRPGQPGPVGSARPPRPGQHCSRRASESRAARCASPTWQRRAPRRTPEPSVASADRVVLVPAARPGGRDRAVLVLRDQRHRGVGQVGVPGTRREGEGAEAAEDRAVGRPVPRHPLAGRR